MSSQTQIERNAVNAVRDYVDATDCLRYYIRFQAPYSLERYVEVITWDDGYLVVLAKYSHNPQSEEEYIDLKPILEGLYIDPVAFLKPI